MSKLFGTGRRVIWNGGNAWIGHTEDQTDFHSHHLIQLTLALSEKVRFQAPGQQWRSYTAAVIASHQPHAFEARGQLVALIFVQPESREGRVLRGRFPSGVNALDGTLFAGEARTLADAFFGNAGATELVSHARAIVARLSGLQDLPVKPLDARVRRAIEQLQRRLGEPVTLAEIASHVHLSAERFRHLFLAETGIRFRPYVLELRMETAFASMAAGKSITEAALDGGFADAAHFARTFRRMYGVSAISVQTAQS
jgi:AraC-like DNA-binding protein